MLPLDGSGGRSERNLPFQVARASDRSLVCTRQTLALRPQTPSSGHLVPTKSFFPLLNVSESCANGDIRLRHFPFIFFHVKQCAPFDQEIKSAAEISEFSSQQNAKVVSFCGSGH